MALEAALVENGVITTDAVDHFVDAMEHRFGPASRCPGCRESVDRPGVQGPSARLTAPPR